MQSKIAIKVGSIEIDFEGSEEFLKQELPNLLKTVSDLFPAQNTTYISQSTVQTESSTVPSTENQAPLRNNGVTGTTNTIAGKLGVKTGPELAIAAAAHLTFVKQQEKMRYKDLLEECQAATTYYKQSYGTNLKRTLSQLVKDGKLSEQAKEVYAIPALERQRLEAILA
jgi:hypothetical protein